MQFGVLGPVEVRADEGVLDLGWPKQRALLAALLLTPNRAVSVSDLVDAVWGDGPPSSAVSAIQKYVSGLRRLLGADRLITREPGYLLIVDPGELDLLRFEVLAAERRWREALALWRGEPCEDVELGESWRPRLQALRERRDAVRGYLIDARLSAGEHDALIAELRTLVAAEPLREQHWARLMRALHGSGRTAEALAAFAQARSVLADELGVEPGADLRKLHTALLVGDEQPAADEVRGSWVTQCQLPLDVGDFVGRDDAASWITRSLTGEGVPVVAVSGPPGVGKTALAVRVAHRLRSHFPDGQWFVRLDGASTAPKDSAAVLANLLQSSGVEGTAVPDGLDARAAALRARLAGRRVLLVLDDAADTDQVRPLLPGVAGSAVLITSRNELLGLTALQGAHAWSLDTLPAADSVALLRRLLRPEQATADASAVAELAELCGHLPLALRIAAANIAGHRGRSIGRYLAELRVNRLAKLAVHGDDRVAVRAAFDLSYQALPADARRLFRLLGLVPGSDFTAPAVAALLDVDTDAIDPLLDRLATANLIQEKVAGRFQFHDLIRLYAAERTRAEDPTTDRDTALHRLFDWYLRMADTAADVLYPALDRLARTRRQIGAFDDAGAAWGWLDAERANMIAAIEHAADHGPRHYAWNLADAMRGSFWFGLLASDWAAAVGAGLRAATDDNNQLAQAFMSASLGTLRWGLGDFDQALHYHQQAVDKLRDYGTNANLCGELSNLAVVYRSLCRFEKAVECLTEGLTISHGDGDQRSETLLLNNLGGTLIWIGRFDEAIDCLTSALTIGTRSGNHLSVLFSLNNLGETCLATGRTQDALAYFDRALRLSNEAGHRNAAGGIYQGLACVYRDLGNTTEALEYARRAIHAARELGEPTYEVSALIAFASIKQQSAQWNEAVDLYTTAMCLAQKCLDRNAELLATLGLASCDRQMGRPADALIRDSRALDVARDTGQLPIQADALAGLARSFLQLGRHGEAVEHAEQALAIYQRTGQRHHHDGFLPVLNEATAATGR